MRRSLLVLCLVFASPALAQEYHWKELANAARDWRQELINSVPLNNKQPGLIAGWRRAVNADYQAKRYAAAINEFTDVTTNGAMTVRSGCGSRRTSSLPKMTVRS